MNDKPKKVRLEVSFELPAGMSRKQANEFVRGAIVHMMHANPSLDLKPDTVKVQTFAVA